jgi:uncharacterized membrane protein
MVFRAMIALYFNTMRSDNAVLPEPKIFSATITPHRSMTRRGFHVLMLCLGVLSVGSGVLFVSIGAWPVFGFFGLDVLILYVALRANFRAARAYEEVTVTPCELTVRKVSHRGAVRQWTLNPVWVRLERIAHAEFGIERLFLVSQGRRLLIAAALGPDEKASFARALSSALGEAKRGPTRTVFD